MSRKFYEVVSEDESLRKEVAKAIQSVVKNKMPKSKQELSDLVKEASRDAKLHDALDQAISSVATRHGLPFDAGEEYDGELSEKELELVAGGPTAVEYAVMLSLIIVVCLDKPSTAPKTGDVTY